MSNPPPPPDCVVFSGGGPDGVAFIGCVRWLEEHGLVTEGLRTVVGCSAGSIVALMLAMRLRSSDMEAWVRDGVATGDLTEVDLEGIWSIARCERMGLDDGERIMSKIRLMVTRRFGLVDDRNDISFLEFAKATGIDLRVSATCLEDCCGVILGMETTPDLGVLKAVRMSISVPLLFTPVYHRGKTYIDGGMFDYCPTSHILDSHIATRTLAFRISSKTIGCCDGQMTKENDVTPTPPGMMIYITMLIRAAMMRSQSSSSFFCRGMGMGMELVDVETIEIPSLIDGGCGVSFDPLSMALAFPSTCIDAYILHGHTECASHFLHRVTKTQK